MMPIPPNHPVFYNRPHIFRFIEAGVGVGVVCRCGWASEIVGSKTTAERLAEQHANEADDD